MYPQTHHFGGGQVGIPTGEVPMPIPGNTGIVPPTMQPPMPAPTYYPGAAGAPSGIHEMSPGVQAVTSAIAGIPGVANGPHMYKDPNKPDFDRDAYRTAMQDWRAQRVSGIDPAARQDWRALRPDRHTFIGAPGV